MHGKLPFLKKMSTTTKATKYHFDAFWLSGSAELPPPTVNMKLISRPSILCAEN